MVVCWALGGCLEDVGFGSCGSCLCGGWGLGDRFSDAVWWLGLLCLWFSLLLVRVCIRLGLAIDFVSCFCWLCLAGLFCPFGLCFAVCRFCSRRWVCGFCDFVMWCCG